MKFATGKFAKYALLINLCVILIAITPIIEKRTQFVISSTLGQLFLQTTSFLVGPYKPKHAEYFMKAPELIKNNGYEVEIHHVNNSEYYRLELHRIPVRNYLKGTEKRGAVLLHHGIFCSSADFVVNKPHEGLAYLLADEGYDVWIGNARGNSYSRFNYKMTPEDPKFWDFSMDEIIEDDMPAIIDYILKTTNQSQLYYIGHSMGATLALGMLASKPEYNNKVKALFALGPGIFMTDATGVIYFFLKQFMYEYFDNGGTMAENSGLGYIAASVLHSPLSFVGSTVLEYSTGDKAGSLNETLLPLYANQLPTGMSKRILRHLGQLGRSGNFTKYDWGEGGNKRIHKQDTPPDYDLSHVTTPTHVFYAENDILTPPSGSRKLATALPNCKGLHKVGTANSGHMYHLWGTDISYHRNLIELLESY